MQQTIGFVGLGNMGLPMAKNLIKAGYKVLGFDISREAIEDIKASGGFAVNELRDLAEANVIFTMLPTGEHVANLYFDESNLVSCLVRNTLLIDCSTISPQETRAIFSRVEAAGMRMLDAPVSGGTRLAQEGTLSFMVGGDPAAALEAEPILLKMGRRVFHAGPIGSGEVAKLCNNMLLAITMIGSCEALQLGIAHGLDPRKLTEIISSSSGANWALSMNNPCPNVLDAAPSSKAYAPGFRCALMLKDLTLAMAAATQIGSSTPLASIARNLFAVHATSGGEDLDFSSIFEFLNTDQRTGANAEEIS